MQPLDVMTLELSDKCKLTLLALMHEAEGGICAPGNSTLATLASISTSSVRRSLDVLEQERYITRNRSHSQAGRANDTITLNFAKVTVSASENHKMVLPAPDAFFAKVTVSASEKAPKKPKTDYEPYRVFWNEAIPPHWVSSKVMTRVRKRGIDELVRDVGDGALECFQRGVLYATTDPWWRPKKITMDNLLSNNKIVMLSEKYDASMTPTAPDHITVRDALKAEYGHN